MAARKKRRRRRRSRFGFLMKLLCIIAVVVALTMGATVFFRVEEIVVSGNSRYSPEEIVEVSGIRNGDNLYGINKNKISGEMRQQLPYIEGVSIRRSLPNTILINVTECSVAATIATPAPLPQEPPKSEEETGEKQEAEKKPKDPPKPAVEPWLVSAKGKLLEPAGQTEAKLLISGITPLDPAVGTMLTVPEEETYKLKALLGLLSALEEQECVDKVSAIEVKSARLDLQYMGRFTVRMPMEEDFGYKLNMLDEVVKRTDAKHGSQAKGSIDLTRGDYAVYSPEST